jgi:hypothetical protein
VIPSNLQELLSYDPHTGRFTWRITKRGHVQAGAEAGTRDPSGYIRIQIDRKLYWAHRVAFYLMTGVEAVEVDHINRLRNDNRWGNLRDVSRHQNGANVSIRSNNTSGIPGVSWNPKARKFQAYITSFRKMTSLGYFSTLEDAAQARFEAEEAIFGRFSASTEVQP